MRILHLAILALCSAALLGCSRHPSILGESECYVRVVQHGVQTLGFPKEMEVLLGSTNVDHFISGFGSQSLTPLWNSVGYFAGRYVVALQVPITIHYDHCKVVSVSLSMMVVQINEVTAVEFTKSGIADAIMRGQWRLSSSEWDRLVQSKGDWRMVQVPIMTNAPVRDFAEFVRQVREPVRPASGG